jgi:hypothetical protein
MLQLYNILVDELGLIQIEMSDEKRGKGEEGREIVPA